MTDPLRDAARAVVGSAVLVPMEREDDDDGPAEAWCVHPDALDALRAALDGTADPPPGDTHAVPPQSDAEREAADALLCWFDTTHGNGFGHDHHCPLGRRETDPERCTCGWSAFELANGRRR